MLNFVNLAVTAASTARRVLTTSILGAGDPGDDGSAERVDGCEVVQPLGLYARPTVTATTEGLAAYLGDRPVILAIIDKGVTAQACEEGGAKLYGPGSGNAATVIYLRASGAIEVTAKTNTNVTVTAGGTGVVVLQNGSQAFIRGNDYSAALATFLTASNAALSSLSAFLGALSIYATAIQPIADPTAVATPPLLTAIAAAQGLLATSITAGTTFSNSSTVWLSTRVTGQ